MAHDGCCLLTRAGAGYFRCYGGNRTLSIWVGQAAHGTWQAPTVALPKAEVL